MKRIIVTVGSNNPVKISATKNAFKLAFGGTIIVKSLQVPNTPIQPLSDTEMIEGAIYRAKYAFNNTLTDFGVGMEGGLIKNRYGVFVKGWVAVTNGMEIGLASTVSVMLPDYTWDLIETGQIRELEEIMVKLSGIKDIGKTIGAIGFMASNRYNREKAFRDALLCALGRFIRSEIFKRKSLEE